MRQTCRTGSRHAPAFTLVELLVVISIIALLIAILLPSLKRAREQGKRVKCMANLKSINTALISYMLSEEEAPLRLEVLPSGAYGNCGWSFGGWSGRNKAHYTVYGSGKYYITTPNRPLSVYMNPKATLREETKLPVFECPSDTISSQGNHLSYLHSPPYTQYSAYDDVGTSYEINMFWWKQGGSLDSSLEAWLAEIDRGQQLWQRYMERGAARWVTLVEDPADAMLRATAGGQNFGFHKQFSRHVFAFVDGHVDYMYADTRKKVAADWTVLDEHLIEESLNP